MPKTPKKKAKATSVIYRPAPFTWLRGRAWLDGDYVYVNRPNAERYEPFRVQSELIPAITRVRSSEDVVAFVERFGLLGLELLDNHRDHWQWYLPIAEHLRTIVRLHRTIADASDGDETARQHIRSWAEQWHGSSKRRVVHETTELAGVVRDMESGTLPADRLILAKAQAERLVAKEAMIDAFGRALDNGDLEAMLFEASVWIAHELTEQLFGTMPEVYDRCVAGESVRPGILRIGVKPHTLKQVCYLGLALALAEKEPLDVCPECERVFVIEDTRQRVLLSGLCQSRTVSKISDKERKDRREEGAERVKGRFRGTSFE